MPCTVGLRLKSHRFLRRHCRRHSHHNTVQKVVRNVTRCPPFGWRLNSRRTISLLLISAVARIPRNARRSPTRTTPTRFFQFLRVGQPRIKSKCKICQPVKTIRKQSTYAPPPQRRPRKLYVERVDASVSVPAPGSSIDIVLIKLRFKSPSPASKTILVEKCGCYACKQNISYQNSHRSSSTCRVPTSCGVFLRFAWKLWD